MKRIQELIGDRLSSTCDRSTPGVALLVMQRDEEHVRLSRGSAHVETEAPISCHTAFDAGSIAKMLTGLSVAMLEDEGRLSTGASIREFLPELPAYATPVSIENLLRHESGLHDYSTTLYFMAGWHLHQPPTSQQVLEALSRTPGLKWEPRSRYEYADANYFLLARAVEQITGTPFGAFVQERLFEPLGMRNSYLTDVGPAETADIATGYAAYPIELESPHRSRAAREVGHHPVGLRYRHVGAEGFRTSVKDLLALGKEILAPSHIDTKTMARIMTPSRIRQGGVGYGYGMNAGTYLGLEFLGHNGMIQGFTASLSIFPGREMVIACLTNREDTAAWSYRDLVLKELLGIEPTRQKRSLSLIAPTPEPQLGLYLDPATSSYLELLTQDGQTSARVNGAEMKPIVVEVQPSEDEQSAADSVALQIPGDGERRTFLPFVESPRELTLAEYAGSYRCRELETTFCVEATDAGIRLTNADSSRPSMDLDYSPTIRDFFWSHDPYPGISQLEFLRETGRVVAFRYRDYDGDEREAFVFERS